jgi:hypothetical protein
MNDDNVTLTLSRVDMCELRDIVQYEIDNIRDDAHQPDLADYVAQLKRIDDALALCVQS